MCKFFLLKKEMMMIMMIIIIIIIIIQILAGKEIVSSPKHPDVFRGPDNLLFNVYLSSYSEAKRSEPEVND
jgi:hypothetical protein